MFKRSTPTRSASTLALCVALLLIYSVIFQSFPTTRGGLVLAKAGAVTATKEIAPGVPANAEAKLPDARVFPQPEPSQLPNAPLVVSITATNRDFPIPNPTVQQGDTIKYVVTITNSGNTDATGVNYNDAIDGNTSTLVPGSPAISPIPQGDTYAATGNVQLNTANIPSDVRTNDTLNSGALSGFGNAPGNANGTAIGGTVTTTNGGTVVLNANGTFTYTSGPGFTGADLFYYTETNTAGPGVAKVTINVASTIWFVNSAAGPGGNGTLTSPFNCLVGAGCFDPIAADDPGDTIFLYNGAYTGGLTLLANQKLVGQGASDTLANISGITPAAGSDALPGTNGNPANVTITTVAAATNGLIVSAGGNLLRGFTVGNTTGAKIFGSSFGTLTAGNSTTPDLALSGTGQALNLTTGTFAATSAFSSVTTTSSSTSGLTLTSVAGTVAFGSTTISGNNNECLITTSSTANINFGNTSCTGGGNGVSLSGNTSGTRTFGTLSVSGGSGNAFSHSGGGGNVTVNGAATLSSAAPDTIVIQNAANTNLINFAGGATVTHTGTGGNGIQWSGVNTGATLTFATLALTTSNGTGMNLAGGGTVNVTTAAGSSISATGVGAQTAPAILVNGLALNANLTTTSCNGSGTAGNCISLATVTGTSNLGGGTLSGAAGATFLVSGGTASVTYAGGITQANNAAMAQPACHVTRNQV